MNGYDGQLGCDIDAELTSGPIVRPPRPTQRAIIANALIYVNLRTGLDPQGFLEPLAEFLDNYVIVRRDAMPPDLCREAP